MKDIRNYVDDILNDIKANKNISKYNKEFDNYDGSIFLSKDEWDCEKIGDKKVFQEIDNAIERIYNFHEKQKFFEINFFNNFSNYSLKIQPISKIGIYIPKNLISTLIMTAIPAKIAKVDDIILCTPPSNIEIMPYIVYIAKKIGIKNIYKIGGVQAIAAMAYGIEIEKVDKIFGPGNKYVNEAKRQVYGDVGIDSLAGPSEICIVADKSAEKEYVYNDLLSQIEHGNDSKAYLITDSKELKEFCLNDRIEIFLIEKIENSYNYVNEIAPEHLQIMTEKNDFILKNIKNAGAIYTGNYTPVPAADYFLGSNHVLPTGKSARFSSSLTVYDFLKFIPVCTLSKGEFMNNRNTGIKIAQIEKMFQHSKSLEVRK
jgi:histidinol dehydrogenase